MSRALPPRQDSSSSSVSTSFAPSVEGRGFAASDREPGALMGSMIRGKACGEAQGARQLAATRRRYLPYPHGGCENSPPSTHMVWPLTYDAASLARNVTTSAMSLGSRHGGA